jgi:hypothetical protein
VGVFCARSAGVGDQSRGLRRERVSRNDVEQVVNQAGDRHVTLRSLAPKGHDEFVLKLDRSVRALWVFVFGLGAHRRQ